MSRLLRFKALGTFAPARWVSLVMLVSAGLAPAQNLTSGFDAANKLYEQGRFAEAASAYEKLLQSGLVPETVYYNLGNAFFKSGEMGRAIVAYRQAEQLSPRDPDLRANLSFARNQVQGPTVSSTWLRRGLGKLSLNEWTGLAAGAVWLCFLLLTLQQWQPGVKRALRSYVLFTAGAAVVLCACLGLVLNGRSSRAAIVITREAVVRQGPLDESQTAFVVHDGAELQVLDQKDEWLQVSSEPRRSGWLRRDQVTLTPRM
jgi:tetratricopeptide (TPR) repeat protein